MEFRLLFSTWTNDARKWLKLYGEFDAILFGAIGDARVPDDVTIWELIMPIRKQFQQYVNFRPVKSLPGIESPLRNGERY